MSLIVALVQLSLFHSVCVFENVVVVISHAFCSFVCMYVVLL